MPTDARKFEGLLRNDFRAFIHKVFTTLCPGQDYERSWHIEAIAYQLERVRRGEITRLIINMPPRSLKSISASVAFPAFLLGRDPSRRIICVSYSAELAKKHSNDFRAVLEAPWYRSVFPSAQIGPYKNSETEIELKDGQSFGIAGLLDERTTVELSKVPGIGDIPILGELFKSRSVNKTNTKLIVLVTPTIVDPVRGTVPVSPAVQQPIRNLDNKEFDKGLPAPNPATESK